MKDTYNRVIDKVSNEDLVSGLASKVSGKQMIPAKLTEAVAKLNEIADNTKSRQGKIEKNLAELTKKIKVDTSGAEKYVEAIKGLAASQRKTGAVDKTFVKSMNKSIKDNKMVHTSSQNNKFNRFIDAGLKGGSIQTFGKREFEQLKLAGEKLGEIGQILLEISNKAGRGKGKSKETTIVAAPPPPGKKFIPLAGSESSGRGEKQLSGSRFGAHAEDKGHKVPGPPGKKSSVETIKLTIPNAIENLATALRSKKSLFELTTRQIADMEKNLKLLHEKKENFSPEEFQHATNLILNANRSNAEEIGRMVHALISVGDRTLITGNQFERAGDTVHEALQEGRFLQRRQEKFEYKLMQKKEKIDKVATGLDVLSPANIGIGTKVSQEEIFETAKKLVREVTPELHRYLSTTAGYRMPGPGRDLTQETPAHLKPYMDTYKEINATFEATGQLQEDSNKAMINNLKRGIRLGNQHNQVTFSGLRLATLIDAEAHATTEELSDWVQHLRLSGTSATYLTQAFQNVSKSTGVTGDRLLSAAKTTKTLMENMRDIGNYTDAAARNTLQIVTEAQKVGTDKDVVEMLDFIQDPHKALISGDEKQRNLAFLSAQRAGPDVSNELYTGTMASDKSMQKRFGQGMIDLVKSNVLRVSGGRTSDITELTKREKGALDVQLKEALGKFPQQILNAGQAIVDGGSTFEEKVAKLYKELDEDRKGLRVLTKKEIEDKKNEIEMLKGKETSTTLSDLSKLLEGKGETKVTLESALKKLEDKSGTKINLKETFESALEPLLKSKKPEEVTKGKTFQNRISNAIASGNLHEIRDIIDDLGKTLQTKETTEKARESSQADLLRAITENFKMLEAWKIKTGAEFAQSKIVNEKVVVTMNTLSGALSTLSGLIGKLTDVLIGIAALKIAFGSGGIPGFGGGPRGGTPPIMPMPGAPRTPTPGGGRVPESGAWKLTQAVIMIGTAYATFEFVKGSFEKVIQDRVGKMNEADATNKPIKDRLKKLEDPKVREEEAQNKMKAALESPEKLEQLKRDATDNRAKYEKDQINSLKEELKNPGALGGLTDWFKGQYRSKWQIDHEIKQHELKLKSVSREQELAEKALDNIEVQNKIKDALENPAKLEQLKKEAALKPPTEPINELLKNVMEGKPDAEAKLDQHRLIIKTQQLAQKALEAMKNQPEPPKPPEAPKPPAIPFDWDIPIFARGGVVTKPTLAMIGEAGPEAIVPLDTAMQGLNSQGWKYLDFPSATPTMPNSAEVSPITKSLDQLLMQRAMSTYEEPQNEIQECIENNTGKIADKIGDISKMFDQLMSMLNKPVNQAAPPGNTYSNSRASSPPIYYDIVNTLSPNLGAQVVQTGLV